MPAAGPETLDALRLLLRTSRGDVIRIARDRCAVPWIAEGLRDGSARVAVVGRYGLPAWGASSAWPAVVVQVRRPPRTHGERTLEAWLAVFYGLEGDARAEILSRRPAESARLGASGSASAATSAASPSATAPRRAPRSA